MTFIVMLKTVPKGRVHTMLKTSNFSKVSKAIITLVFAGFSLISTSGATADVNIYSARQSDLIAPLLDAFTAETGIKTKSLFLKKGLVDRIKAEGALTPADLILTVDIARLTAAKDAGITQAVIDTAIINAIPVSYRDVDNQWFGLTVRGRVIYASKERVAVDAIDYEDLGNPEWKGRVCIRSGQHPYNLSLFSSLIAHLGLEAAETWLTGLKANLARKPNGNDRAQAKGIFTGECDLGIGNTYYVGLMKTNKKDPEQKEWAKSIKVLFPNGDNRGTHVNLSGMALTKHAKNKDDALKLMKFLTSKKAQEIYATAVHEYPIVEGTQASDIVQSFGEIKPDAISLNRIAELRAEASKMVDRVGFNN